MVGWVVGLPLLFWRRWPRLTRAYAKFAIAFVIVNQLSQLWLEECVFTTVARSFWTMAGSHPAHLTGWFTIRFAELVFGLSPSHRSITIATQVLVVAMAIGLFPQLRAAALAPVRGARWISLRVVRVRQRLAARRPRAAVRPLDADRA